MIRVLVGGLLLFVGTGDFSGPQPPSARAGAVEVEPVPDPTQAKPLDHWADESDLARLASVEGKSKAVILKVLGHPAGVEFRPDGEELWTYPWCAICCVRIRNGVCTSTFYTAGY
jgi:hypothetical protein